MGGGGGGGAKNQKKNYPQKKIRGKKVFPGIVRKKIPSLENKLINFTLKKYFQPSSEKRNIFLL